MTNGKRAGSPHEAAEFAAMTKRDAKIRMDHELKELTKSCNPEDKEVKNSRKNHLIRSNW